MNLKTMALMSPLRYRWHRVKEALFGDSEIIYEVLLHHKSNLPNTIHVSWERDGEFIVGKIEAHNETLIAQGRSANDFIESVNDTLYAAYHVPMKYAERFGGDYRLTPPAKAFAALNDAAIQKSSLSLELTSA